LNKNSFCCPAIAIAIANSDGNFSISKILTFSFVLGYFVFSYRHFNTTPTETTEIKTSDQQHQIRQKNETKTILVWNAFERAEVRIFGKGKDVIANQNCTYT
jgi:hypothetical protein